LESGTQTGENENEEDESEWRAKKTAVSRKIIPADGSKPASAMNGDLGTPPLTPSDQSTAYLSPTGVAKSKDCYPLTAAAA
jgi:hypothetical protein